MKKMLKKMMVIGLILVGSLTTTANADILKMNNNDEQLINFESNLPSRLQNELPKMKEIKIMYGNEFYNTLESYNVYNECVGNTIMNNYTKDIFIYVQYDCDTNREYSTFVHELFHGIDYLYGYTKDEEFVDIYMEEKGFFQDNYFNNNIMEFFAESGAWYVSSEQTKEQLKSECPMTFTYIENILNNK